MIPNDSFPDSDDDLTVVQRAVLADLLAGQSVTDAALHCEVGRATVHRWLKADAFRRALAEGRATIRAAVETRLTAIAERAVDVLDRAIVNGETRAALEILKGLAILGSSRAAEPSEAYRPIDIAPARERLAALLELQYENLQAAAAEDALVSDD